MDKIFKISFNGVNSYLINSRDEACLVDASMPVSILMETISGIRDYFKFKYILLTHGHLNHVRYVSEVRSLSNGKTYIHVDDRPLLREEGIGIDDVYTLRGFDKFKVGDIEIIVYHTPGHTDGSVCFYSRELNAIFTGDTLMKGGFGKIRGPHSMSRMLKSLKTISRLIPPDTTVYPGHGFETRLEDEAWLDGLDMLS
ncbi:MAG: MBL fold metallo-hydrolase [Nitrososphaerota archaeon]